MTRRVRDLGGHREGPPRSMPLRDARGIANSALPEHLPTELFDDVRVGLSSPWVSLALLGVSAGGILVIVRMEEHPPGQDESRASRTSLPHGAGAIPRSTAGGPQLQARAQRTGPEPLRRGWWPRQGGRRSSASATLCKASRVEMAIGWEYPAATASPGLRIAVCEVCDDAGVSNRNEGLMDRRSGFSRERRTERSGLSMP